MQQNNSIPEGYTIVQKQFFNKLLMNSVNPMVYFTKSLTKKEQKMQAIIEDMMEEQLQASKEWLQTQQASQIAAETTALRSEAFSKLEDKMDEIVNSKADSVESMMTKFYEEGNKLGCTQLGKEVKFTLADQQALYSVHQYDFDLIRELNKDLTDQIRTEIWRGVGEGSSIPAIQERLSELPIQPLNVNGRVLTPEQRGKMIARTEVNRARNAGAIQAYANYGVELVDVMAEEDDNCCDYCLELSQGGPYALSDVSNLIPAHPNCRCAIAPHVLGDETANDVPENPNDEVEVVDLTTDDTEENATVLNEEISKDELENGTPDFDIDAASVDDADLDYSNLSNEDLAVEYLNGNITSQELFDYAGNADNLYAINGAVDLLNGDTTPEELQSSIFEDVAANSLEIANNISNDGSNEYILENVPAENVVGFEEVNTDNIVANENNPEETNVENLDEKVNFINDYLEGNNSLGDVDDIFDYDDKIDILNAVSLLNDIKTPENLEENLSPENYSNMMEIVDAVNNPNTTEVNDVIGIEEVDASNIVAPQDIEPEEYAPNIDLPEEVGEVVQPFTEDNLNENNEESNHTDTLTDYTLQLLNNEIGTSELPEDLSENDIKSIAIAYQGFNGSIDEESLGFAVAQSSDIATILDNINNDNTNDYSVYVPQIGFSEDKLSDYSTAVLSILAGDAVPNDFDNFSSIETDNIKIASDLLNGNMKIDFAENMFPNDFDNIMNIVNSISNDENNIYDLENIQNQAAWIPENFGLPQTGAGGLDVLSIVSDIENGSITSEDLEEKLNHDQTLDVVHGLTENENMDKEDIKDIWLDLKDSYVEEEPEEILERDSETNTLDFSNYTFDKQADFQEDFDGDMDRLANYINDNNNIEITNINISDKDLNEFALYHSECFPTSQYVEWDNPDLEKLGSQLYEYNEGKINESDVDWGLLDNKLSNEVASLGELHGEIYNHLDEANIINEAPDSLYNYEKCVNLFNENYMELFDVQNTLSDEDLNLFYRTNEIPGYDKDGFDWNSVSNNFNEIQQAALNGVPLTESQMENITSEDVNGLRESFKSFDFRNDEPDEEFSEFSPIEFNSDKEGQNAIESYSYGFDSSMNKFCNMNENEFKEYAQLQTEKWISDETSIPSTEENIEEYTEKFIQQITDKVENASNILDTESINEPVITYRGTNNDLHLDNKNVGSINEMSQFTSTSVNYNVAEGFGSMKLEVLNPAGNGSTLIGSLSKFPQEMEVLIKDHTQFQIIQINNDKSAATVLRLN